jgi:hypothetical protein
MGMSPNGILAYGYNLGGSSNGWEIEQAGEFGEWEPPWDNEGDPITGVENALLASVGFTETDWQQPGYYDHKAQAEASIGVQLRWHGSDEFSDYLLITHRIQAEWSDAQQIDFTELDRLRVEHDWDSKLHRALETLAITPKQGEPAWLLTSYWG